MTDAATASPAAPAAAPVSAPAPAAPAASPAPTPAASAPPAAPVASPAPAAPAAAPAAATPAAPAAAPAEAPAAPPAGAPEKYEFTAPEGASAFNDTVLATYADAARELNLTQDGAQALLSKVGPVIQAQQKAALTEFYADIGGLPETWAAQVAADKEIGGDKMAENLAVAAKARDLGGPEFVKLLDKTGLGNHPEVIRTFHRIGKALSEDKFVAGGGAQTATPSAAQRMYPPKTK